MTLETTCGHCGDNFPMSEGHDCEPECHHCGATFDDLEGPEYESAKIAVSRHQRECDERPDGWGANIRDPEAGFRENRRQQEKQRRDDRRIEEMRRRGEI
jgi:hypothetical protein